MATPNYAVDENDERLVAVRDEEKAELTKSEELYGGMIADTKKYYDGLKDEVDRYADEQTKLQNERTDFTIDKIEQQKEQTHKDYLKEQSGAYTDWQKESNRYGVNAERQAAAGMAGTGYSESSQVRLYTAYQNRVATARESYNRAVLEYDNGIREAKLQNDVLLAEIQHEALQKKLELSLEGFQYNNTLLLDQAAKRLEIKNAYFDRYKATLDQINTENARAEEVRQYNETMALQREQFNWQKEQAAKEEAARIENSSRTYKTSAGTIKSGGSGTIRTDSTKSAFEQNNNGADIFADGESIKTYEAATAFLKKNGVEDYNLMTRSEWSRRKASWKSTGIGGAEVSGNETYSDYLLSAVKYALS